MNVLSGIFEQVNHMELNLLPGKSSCKMVAEGFSLTPDRKQNVNNPVKRKTKHGRMKG